MRIGLIPLDERPVNSRYPAMIAEIAGVDLVLPPFELLSSVRQPAQSDQIAAWLLEQTPTLDTLIVSIQMLGFGGLIASRITHEPSQTILSRMNVLRQIKSIRPDLPIYGFDLITRISRSNNNFEEPHYWDTYGTRLYTYSQWLDRQLQGQAVTEEIQHLRDQLPDELVQDFMARRLRNHIVNLATIEMLKDEVFDLLVLSSDDTSEYGLGSREKRWLAELVARNELGDNRLLMYPGADEVGCVLLARAVNANSSFAPRFAIQYAIEGDEVITAPFEDGPVQITVERQVRAVGGLIVKHGDQADFVVAVNTPSRRKPSHLVPTDEEYDHRYNQLKPFIERVQKWLVDGQDVIVADVAYPNSADPAFVDLLRENIALDRLAAYGAWNTAGNTIGVALAHGIATRYSQQDAQKEAGYRFLTHRFVEDWGYQYAVRPQLQLWLQSQTVSSELEPNQISAAQVFVEDGLQARLDQLADLAEDWCIVPGSIRFPWQRTFDVDFDLEKR